MEAMEGIPYSNHSLKSLREGTLFPSIEAAHREKNKRRERENEDLFSHAKAIRKRGGIADPFEPDLDEEIKRMRNEELLQDFNRQKGNTMPVMSEAEMTVQREIDRVERLRRLSDRVQASVREKMELLKKLKSKVIARDQHDEYLTADIVAGDCAIEVLETRANAMMGALDEARTLGNGYSILIELLKACPPFTDKHVKTQEQHLALAKQQLADLIQHRHNMYMDVERIEDVRKRQITDKITYYRDVRRELREKIKAFYQNSMEKELPIPPLEKGSLLNKYIRSLQRRANKSGRRRNSRQNVPTSTATGSGRVGISSGRNGGGAAASEIQGKAGDTSTTAAGAGAGAGTTVTGKHSTTRGRSGRRRHSRGTAAAGAAGTAGAGAGAGAGNHHQHHTHSDGVSVLSFADRSEDDSDNENYDADDFNGHNNGEEEVAKLSTFAIMFGKFITRKTKFALQVLLHIHAYRHPLFCI
jgi:hypothetical protein